uniref:Uncharacterized protein n=1 Tax=Oryza glumipatula TaxID=40148 RepID=A0A0E0BF54_9ORYZ
MLLTCLLAVLVSSLKKGAQVKVHILYRKWGTYATSTLATSAHEPSPYSLSLPALFVLLFLTTVGGGGVELLRGRRGCRAARVAEVVTGKESGDGGGACCPARKRRTSPELGRGQAQAHIRIRQPPPSRQASVPHPQAPLPPSNSTSPSSSSSTGELGYDRRGGPCPGSRRRSARKGRLGMCLSLVAATSPLLYRHRSPTPQAQECHHRCSRALGGRRIERKREEEMREEEEVAPWLWTEMWSKFLFAEWTSTSMPHW